MKLYKLKDVATIEISGVDKKFKEDEIPIYLCNFTDVYYNWAITSDIRNNFIAASANKKEIDRFKLRKGQVALTKDSETRYDIGISTYIAEDFKDVILGYHCALITPNKDKINGKYLNAFIHSDYIRKYFENSASGSGQRYSLSIQTLEDMPILLPSIEKQLHIGKILSDIDRKIALNKAINHNLVAMAKQLYDYWFVQFDFPNEEGKPYKSSGGKMVWNEKLKREIPEGWNAKRIDEITIVYNGATPSTTEEDNYRGDIIWITPKDLSSQQQKFIYQGERNISQKGYDSCSTHILPINSILMSSRAPIGLLAITKTELCTNQGFKNFVPKEDYFSTYLYYYLLSHIKQIEQLGTGTTFKEVSREDISAFLILFPLEETLRQWEKIIYSIDNKQLSIQKQMETLTKQRDELLPLLMNGQVTVG